MEWVLRLWTHLMGDLPHWPEPERDDRLLMVVGLAACAALYLANGHPARGPMPYGIWRMLMFGGLPLCALALWAAFIRGGSRLGAMLAAVMLCVPTLTRLLGEPNIFKEQPLLLLPGIIAMLLALAVVARSEESLADWGIGLGDWRWWLPRAAAFAGVVLVGVILTMNLSPEMAAFYPTYKPARTNLSMLLMKQLSLNLDFVGWELLFRGFLLFGIARRGDAGVAIWLQCIPFFLLHDHKPDVELLLSLPGGLIAGWFCLRARSFVPIFLLHCFQMSAVNFVGFALRNGIP